MSIDLILQESIDVRDRRSFVLASFEAHFSEVTFGTCVPSKTGRGFLWSKGKSCRDILDDLNKNDIFG